MNGRVYFSQLWRLEGRDQVPEWTVSGEAAFRVLM